MLKQPEQDQKFFVTTRTLHARRQRPGLFSDGDYISLQASGPRAENVFAFIRQLGRTGERAIVAVPRLVTGIGKWNNTTVRVPRWRARHVFTGKTINLPDDVPVAELFTGFPVALLIADAGER
jgi:(1->4)-alpha-D-glucan 1-alpha-D-glucosylmutase